MNELLIWLATHGTAYVAGAVVMILVVALAIVIVGGIVAGLIKK